MKINITLSKNLKQKPDENTLVFGRTFSDHMFTMDYNEQNGWHNPQILPYGNIELDPASMILHYGQEANKVTLCFLDQKKILKGLIFLMIDFAYQNLMKNSV